MVISTERTSEEFLRLNSCARQHVYLNGFHILRENGRSDWHILYITNGCCYIDCDTVPKKVEKGNIILYRPFERQYYRFPDGEDTLSCFIHFCGRGCEEIISNAGITERITYVGLNGIMDNLFTRLCEEYTLKKAMYEEICSGILYEFLMQAGRLNYYHKNNINIRNENNMNKICKQMYRDLTNNKSVKDYADMCCLSVDRFSHSFKESIGISPKQYMMKLRIDTACELLVNTPLDLAAIAENVGISDVNYFCRIFKKHTGKPPSYFRK